MKLDMGAGAFPREGYVTVDAYTEADIRAPMWDVGLEDGCAETIYSCHALEHVAKAEVVPTLREWARLLKPGGYIEIIVPDLEWCCKEWLVWQTNGWHMDILFGGQGHAGEFHKTGFTFNLMQAYAAEAGLRIERFERVDSHGQPSLYFEMRHV
jgi:predicted SAM-dependent methyltransferase